MEFWLNLRSLVANWVLKVRLTARIVKWLHPRRMYTYYTYYTTRQKSSTLDYAIQNASITPIMIHTIIITQFTHYRRLLAVDMHDITSQTSY
jgi:hypothetical protein